MKIIDDRKKKELKLEPGDVICYWDDVEDVKSYALVALTMKADYDKVCLIDVLDGFPLDSSGFETDKIINYSADILSRDLNNTWDHVEVVDSVLYVE